MENRDMPAMPLGEYQLTEEVTIKGSDCTTINYIKGTGLTKREHFAGLAMAAMVSNSNLNGGEGMDAKSICEFSVKFSEGLLEALEKDDETS